MQINRIMQDFFTYTFDRKKTLHENIIHLETLRGKLTGLGQECNETIVITKILTILPKSLNHFASAWESTPKEDQTLTNLTSRLIGEQMRLTDNEDKETASAFKSNVKCFACQKTGHISRFCDSKPRKYKSCEICKKDITLDKIVTFVTEATISLRRRTTGKCRFCRVNRQALK